MRPVRHDCVPGTARLTSMAIGVVVAGFVMMLAACTGSSPGGSGTGSATPPTSATASGVSTGASSGSASTGGASSSGASSGGGTTPAPTDLRTDLVTPTAKPTGPAPGPDPTGIPTTAVVDPALAPYVGLATSDLAARLGVPADGIEVVTAITVTWPDTSLGCPKPGMSYPQTPVDGAMIVLRAGDKDYGYRAGGDKKPFLCEV
jgi:hypothetical protein